ncbi:alpha-tubulin N-acetyltransferase [Plasmodium falciparum NF54]|uniref:Alpha-tubulin N-acetyltransferase n=2 Tax=Plasmodium falciparum TaxID=5833 RepID=ATAT_PLAF7|nr:alpha-tubulin N-acetyltransferase, putative [Plasmodium falciparum 3D7]C0H559.2 RecName: Full=Alpha-tubulin N-acetyltransferase; Short=Alpha-TAT; Short=TAT; AltName: Full=Acetyltransferase mec-17 homolog [Plasmodium falciparum 3D7]KAF4330651.1 alpha-tubulin N-acetyltransferase [Plasmodium falciparum NF54]SOS78483.1 alpha-tubulin N-acetyltransferase, putative [Plasmodium sp. gorilla clade G1]PKC45132.1 alpha-tubulin N-acetyltransferase [Plasmodium falciparum NF54]CAX64236.2 alpha-tubulin N-a|eukprot:XP_024328965.1 alpha-tubulin N-acetyltransferase, putative [Plasmodium falciparum 3D7]
METFNHIDIKKYTREDLLYLRNTNNVLFKMFQKQVDEIACLSSKEQKLCGTLTSINNIINENYTIYCLIHTDGLIGFIKIGEKNLYLYDKIKLHYGKCTCVLDFYILEKFQKRGLGIKIFNFMLKDNDISAFCLCYDNPSYKLQNFLKKYFSPCVLIKQPNHFVIFSNYFKNVSIKKVYERISN